VIHRRYRGILVSGEIKPTKARKWVSTKRKAEKSKQRSATE